MAKVIDFEVLKYASTLLEEEKWINPLLIAEFKKAINAMDTETWEKLRQLDKQLAGAFVSSIEYIIYTVLAVNIGPSFFEKDSDLISVLVINLAASYHICPLNFVRYAKFFLEEPVYSETYRYMQDNDYCLYSTFIEYLLNQFDLFVSEEERRIYFIKILYESEDMLYHYFFKENDSVESMYAKLYRKMMSINEEKFTFTSNDFMTLKRILHFAQLGKQAKEYVVSSLLEAEQKENEVLDLIRRVLYYCQERFHDISYLQLVRKAKDNAN